MRDLLTRIDPAITYYTLKCGYALFYTIVVSVSLIFQTTEVGLSAMQLLLVAAALQGAILVSEMPTGVVADTYGRKRSVLIGLVLLGAGTSLSGAIASFWPIFVGHLIWGFGHTFISGAAEAWIADEVGVPRANRIYLRTAQITKLFWIAAIPISIGIATYDLNLPILIGGAGFALLAIFLTLTMQEDGFQRPARPATRQTWRDIGNTLNQSRSLVSSSPLLVTILLIMAFYGMAGQGFITLWVAHFDRNLTFPTFWHLKPVIWFGAVRMAAALLSLVVVEFIRRWRIESFGSHAIVSRSLFWINAIQMLSVLIIATTGSFAIAAAFICDRDRPRRGVRPAAAGLAEPERRVSRSRHRDFDELADGGLWQDGRRADSRRHRQRPIPAQRDCYVPGSRSCLRCCSTSEHLGKARSGVGVAYGIWRQLGRRNW